SYGVRDFGLCRIALGDARHGPSRRSAHWHLCHRVCVRLASACLVAARPRRNRVSSSRARCEQARPAEIPHLILTNPAKGESAMEVILLERVHKLGQMGEVVRVKDGFARNFLLPRGKALRATKENRSRFESMKVELEAKNLELRGEAA